MPDGSATDPDNQHQNEDDQDQDQDQGQDQDQDQDQAEFFRIYGPWEPLTPTQIAGLMAGFPAPWWIVGGRAVEAFTGVPRDHEDTDVAIFSEDFRHLRTQLAGRYHLWSNDGGTFRHVSDENPEPLAPQAQTWIRAHAGAPWVMDVILDLDGGGRWRARRDLDLVAPLDDVTWVAGDGIRYLNPEIVLFFKAKAHRPKDERDLAAALPLLSTARKVWLRDAIASCYPGHAWEARLGPA